MNQTITNREYVYRHQRIYLIYFLISIMFTIIGTPAWSAEGTVETVTYQSSIQNASCKMNIYLPPSYNDAGLKNTSYPVLYLFHGYGGNHNDWIAAGEIKTTLDDYISSLKCVPMIIVMPDCNNLATEIFSKELINDIIPYVESHYRVIKDKDHRGVGGLSWGGLQALDAGIYHYEMFGYVTIMSSGWFANDNAAYEKLKSFMAANVKAMDNSFRYFYFGEGTKDDVAYSNGHLTLNILKDNGLTVHYWEHPGGHSWTTWKADFITVIPFLFKGPGIRYVSLDFQGGDITASTILTKVNTRIPAPADPMRSGYTFAGWYKEPAYTHKYDFSEKVKRNITLYAKWLNK